MSEISRAATAISALLMTSAYFTPLWQILMWAPQYPEGLEMKIWINNLTGNVKLISALNHYIGMRPIEVSMFPEFGYMVYIVGGIIALGFAAALLNSRSLLWMYTGLIVAAGIGALVDFYMWGYDYGHNLNPEAPIIVPGMSYQPPLIGTKQLLNFTAFSGPDVGGWIFMSAGVLAVVGIAYEIFISGKKGNIKFLGVMLAVLTLGACSTKPEPLSYGRDACYACKMTLIDHKYGAEIVTTKGKIYKFDDLNCMIGFYKSGFERKENLHSLLATDFAGAEELMDVTKAAFLMSPSLRSPMGSGVAAFRDEGTVQQASKEWGGEVLNWEQLLRKF